jgi:hypothetical protein
MQGNRYQSNGSKFHSWSNMGPMIGKGEHGGQWWIPMPNQADGSPPPVGAPNFLVNVGGGDQYLWGTYHSANESFTPYVPSGAAAPKMTELEGGKGGWWGAQNANGRMLMIGWALGDYNGPAGPGITFLTRLTLLREVSYDLKTNDLVSNPVPELLGLRSPSSLASEKKVALAPNTAHYVAGTAGGAAASADIELNFTMPAGGGSVGACVLAEAPGGKPFVPHWETVPNSNAGFAMVGVPGNKSTFLGELRHYLSAVLCLPFCLKHCLSGVLSLGNATDAAACQALCEAVPGKQCLEWAWHIFGPKPPPAFANSTDACYMVSKVLPFCSASYAVLSKMVLFIAVLQINHPKDLTTPLIRPQP